jgi:hypothetical protein
MKKKLVALALILAISLSFVGYLTYTRSVSGEQQTSYPALTVFYTDGTNSTFTGQANAPQLSFIDYALNKEVTKVIVAFHVIAAYSGTLSSYSVSGASQGLLYDVSTNQQLASLWGPTSWGPYTDSMLVSGQDKVVWSSEITVASIKAMYTNWQNGKQYYYAVYCPSPISMTLNLNGQQPSTLTAMPTRVAWQFTYNADSSFTSLSAYFSGTGQ